MSAENLIAPPKPRLAEWLMEPMRRNRATYWKVALAAAFINIFGLLTALFTRGGNHTAGASKASEEMHEAYAKGDGARD